MKPHEAQANPPGPPSTRQGKQALALVAVLALAGLPMVVHAVPAELRGVYDMRYKMEIDRRCKTKGYFEIETRSKRRRAGTHRLRVDSRGIAGGLQKLSSTLSVRLPRRVKVTQGQRFSARARGIIILVKGKRPFNVSGRFRGGVREAGSRSKLVYVFRGVRRFSNSRGSCVDRVTIRAVGFD